MISTSDSVFLCNRKYVKSVLQKVYECREGV